MSSPQAFIKCCKSASINAILNVSTLIIIALSIVLLLLGFKWWWLVLLLGILIVLIIQLIVMWSVQRFQPSKHSNTRSGPVVIATDTNPSSQAMTPVEQYSSIDYSPVSEDVELVEGFTPLSDSEDEGVEKINDSQDECCEKSIECPDVDNPDNYYILPSRILPSQTDYTFSNSLDNAKRYMNAQSNQNALEFRHSIMSGWLCKSERWRKYGCCSGPYQNGKPQLIE